MRTPTVPAFRIRFPIDEIGRWANRYSYADDTEVIRIGQSAGRRGWYTRREFLAITTWKTERTKSRCARNTEMAIHDATELALRTDDERLRIGVLTHLQGVRLPTASVLLHLAHRDPYPILDVRALWSLGIEPAPAYQPYEFWAGYTQACRDLASRARVDMRTLDHALWQYSVENQVGP